MSEAKLTVVAAADLAGKRWQIQEPLPDTPASKIVKMFLINDLVEVFALPTHEQAGQPRAGLHVTLMPPTVSLVVSAGPLNVWSDVLSQFDAAAEDVIEVIDITGKSWRKDHPVPGENDTTIVRMFVIDDLVEAFVQPLAGSQLEQAGIGLHFTLMPLTVQRVRSSAPIDKWTQIMKDFEVASEFDEDEEEEEEESPLIPQAPGFGAPMQSFVPPVHSGFVPGAAAITAATTQNVAPNGQSNVPDRAPGS